jgi:hypothetical protein
MPDATLDHGLRTAILAQPKKYLMSGIPELVRSRRCLSETGADSIVL